MHWKDSEENKQLQKGVAAHPLQLCGAQGSITRHDCALCALCVQFAQLHELASGPFQVWSDALEHIAGT